MADLPTDTIETAERLTRLARQSVDGNEATTYRQERDAALAEHGYVARVREDEQRNVLVCYPEEWVVDGTVRTDHIDDLDRAVERPLDGTGEEDDYDRVEAHNREVSAEVAETHGQVHGANANAFADFMSNHYLREVESARPAELEEFLSEYFPRNAWPSDHQWDVVEESLRLVFEETDTSVPPPIGEETDNALEAQESAPDPSQNG